MIPSILSQQVRGGIEDFLRTTFPIHTPFFSGGWPGQSYFLLLSGLKIHRSNCASDH